MNKYPETRPLFGTETEVTVEAEWDPRWPAEFTESYIRRHFPPITHRINGEPYGYLGNGARLYEDLKRMEWATPEVETSAEIIRWERVGERYADLILANMAAEGILKNWRLRKGVIDTEGNAWGYHMNFLYRRGAINFDTGKGVKDMLLPFTSTRGVLTGAGGVLHGNLLVAQKSACITEEIDLRTYQEKPVINTRDEPHAPREHFCRHHDVSGDTHVSWWSLRMQVGLTKLVLRMIEQECALPEEFRLRPKSGRGLARLTALDPTLKRTFMFADGKWRRPIDVQIAIWELAEVFCQEYGASKDDQWVLDETAKALTELERDPELLADRADWVAVNQKILNALGTRGYDADALKHREPRTRYRAQAIAVHVLRDYETLAVYPERNPPREAGALRARKLLRPELNPPEALVQKGMSTPPPGGRAEVRGNFIQNNPPNGIKAGWDYIRGGEDESFYARLGPYGETTQQGRDPRWDDRSPLTAR